MIVHAKVETELRSHNEALMSGRICVAKVHIEGWRGLDDDPLSFTEASEDKAVKLSRDSPARHFDPTDFLAQLSKLGPWSTRKGR